MNKTSADPKQGADEDSSRSTPRAVAFPPRTFNSAKPLLQFETLLLLLSLAAVPVGWAGDAGTNAESATVSSQKPRLSDLAAMSLEDLTRLEVTSVSKHKEKLTDAPAAVYVITGEDIRRSGVTSIAEALRMAP